MSQELTSKVALVTGSGRGIGRAIALRLAELGCNVVISDVPGSKEAPETLREVKGRGIDAILAPMNVTDGSAVKNAVKGVLEKWGKIDILVNNAGVVGTTKPAIRISEEDWDHILDTNLRGAFLCTKYALPSMMTGNWGRVINIASVAGLMGSMGRVGYSASKGGLISFTRSLAHEVGAKNITVNAIAPGFIETDMTANLPQYNRDTILSRTSLKRLGKPEDVAGLAAFLATDRASYITGQVIPVDGGIL